MRKGRSDEIKDIKEEWFPVGDGGIEEYEDHDKRLPGRGKLQI